MGQYYLRVEAVNLSQFTGDTQDLSTIRGGSLLLLNAVEDLMYEHPQLQRLTTGASAGLYSFVANDAAEAEDIRRQIDAYFHSHPRLKYATFVVDIQPETGSASFAQDLAILTTRNRWRQMQAPTLSINQLQSEQVCDFDLVRPAPASPITAKGKEQYASLSVQARRRYGIEMKQAFYRQQIGVEARFVTDLEDLTTDADKGNLNGKMAVIYLDGNQFGAIKNQVKEKRDEWLQFDEQVKQQRRTMLHTLIAGMAQDKDWQTDEREYRIETLLWGGDEIIWVVPAWKGWETLATFYQVSALWEFQGEPLRHAGGLVFCHHHAPIHRITKLARELAELAKQKDRGQNLFAYEVLESFDHIGRDLPAYRQERCPQPLDADEAIDDSQLILAGETMFTVMQLAQDLRERLPRRQLHAVVENLLTTGAVAAERQQGLAQLVQSLHAAGMSEAQLTHLATTLGGDHLRWLHLNNLWDYLTTGSSSQQKGVAHA